MDDTGVDLDVVQARVNLHPDKFCRQRASRRVAMKRLYQRRLVVTVCVEGVCKEWVAATLLLVLWLLRIRSKKVKVQDKGCASCAVSLSSHCKAGHVSEIMATTPDREMAVMLCVLQVMDFLLVVVRLRLIMSGDVELNPGPLDQGGCS